MSFFKKIFGKTENHVKFSNFDYNVCFDETIWDKTPLTILSLGDLYLPTGNIIVCDPLVYLNDCLPLEKKVKPGKYPVTVSVAHTKDSGNRYSVVKLEFSKNKPTKWQLATTKTQDVKELMNEDEFFGFPVDAGLGCFMDTETERFYSDFDSIFMKQHPTGNIYDDLLANEFKKNAMDSNNSNDIGDWLNFSLPNRPELNVIMFQSGFGDGIYPAYWGLTDKGETCSLVIDFWVLNHYNSDES